MAPRISAKPLNKPSKTRVMRRVATESLTNCFHRGHREYGLVFVDGMHGIANLRGERRGIGRRFNQQTHSVAGILPGRDVHFEARGIRQAVEFRVAHHADNRVPLRRIGCRRVAKHEALADRIFVREKAPRNRGINHRCERRVFVVLIGEAAAAQEGDSKSRRSILDSRYERQDADSLLVQVPPCLRS